MDGYRDFECILQSLWINTLVHIFLLNALKSVVMETIIPCSTVTMEVVMAAEFGMWVWRAEREWSSCNTIRGSLNWNCTAVYSMKTGFTGDFLYWAFPISSDWLSLLLFSCDKHTNLCYYEKIIILREILGQRSLNYETIVRGKPCMKGVSDRTRSTRNR